MELDVLGVLGVKPRDYGSIHAENREGGGLKAVVTLPAITAGTA